MFSSCPPDLLRKSAKQLGCGLYGHDIAEGLELFDMPSRGAVTVPALNVLGAEFVIGDAVAHHVIRDLEDLVAGGDDGLFVAPAGFDARIAGLQARTASCARRRPRLG